MSASGPPVLLRGVDRGAFAVAFAARLRTRGIAVGFTGVEDFVRALDVSPPDSLPRLHWAARISLVRRRSDLDVFDATFAAVFQGATLAVDPNARRTPLGPSVGGDDDALAHVPGAASEREAGRGLPWLTLPPAVSDADDSDSTFAVPERLPSAIAAQADEPFENLDEQEMQLLGRWLESAVRTWPTRRSRTMAADRAGRRIAVRPTIARSRRTGWEAIELVRERPVDKRRKVVMLCDVSQSMQAQANAYLHLMRALALVGDAEVFAFATTLTRLTPAITHRSAAVAIGQATVKVTDRFGGTRIASNVEALLASHHGGATRGAIVIVASDGWDSDPPERLAAAMARLRRRAYRVIWINPRVAAPGFEPRVSSMVAALPYCDRLLAAHNFRALAGVVAEISSTASRGSTAGSGRR